MTEISSLANDAPRRGFAPSGFPGVLVSLIIVGAMFGVTVGLSYMLQPDEALLSAAHAARDRITRGDLLGLSPAELIGLVNVGAGMFLSPLLLLGGLLLVELAAGPARREIKNYRLIWLAQIVFISTVTLLTYFGIKLGLAHTVPLVRIDSAASALPAFFVTLSSYIFGMFISDFLQYWLHRGMHKIPLLWKFHKVHHSPRDLNVLHFVIHPVDEVLQFIIITVPVAFLIRVNTEGFFIIVTLFLVHRHYIHMNVPVGFGRFRNLLCDNRFHFVHHSRTPSDFNTNFAGIFPIFDMVFGTYRRPDAGPLPETGLEGIGAPAKLSHYLLGSWPPERAAPAGAVGSSAGEAGARSNSLPPA